jgi:anti-sigma28 factor (negative regulator of flagellin synthesis)
MPRIEQASNVSSTERQDRVEISDVARWKAKLAEVSPMRDELVESVRAQIEAGTYETDAKIRVAAERLLADLKEEGAF